MQCQRGVSAWSAYTVIYLNLLKILHHKITPNCPSVIFIHMFSLDPQVSSSLSGMQHWLMLQTWWKDDISEMVLVVLLL